MPARAALRWLDARGWLVLAGRDHGNEAFRARALSLAASDGPVAVLACGGEDESARRALDDFGELADRPAYLVDAFVEDDESLRASLSEAGIILAAGAGDPLRAHDALSGASGDGIRSAWEAGALVLLEGPAAMCAGACVLSARQECREALAWLPGTLVLPGVGDPGAGETARDFLARRQRGLVLGIGPAAALALGPAGELDIWGEAEVGIVLGPAWRGD